MCPGLRQSTSTGRDSDYLWSFSVFIFFGNKKRFDFSSRHSSCLTNFLLNDRSVMLEMPMSKRSGAKVLSHMLTSHAGEIFIHTLNISRTIVEDPPNIADGKHSWLKSPNFSGGFFGNC